MQKVFAIIFIVMLVGIAYFTFRPRETTKILSPPTPLFETIKDPVPSKEIESTSNEPQIEITENDNGKSISYPTDYRFSFNLDPTLHPLKDLKVTCDKADSIAGISNLSVNGPDNYPNGFETRLSGICIVKNGTFSATIVISDR